MLYMHPEYDPKLKDYAIEHGILLPWRMVDSDEQFVREYLRFARDLRVSFLLATLGLGSDVSKLIWCHVLGKMPRGVAPSPHAAILPRCRERSKALKLALWGMDMYERPNLVLRTLPLVRPKLS